MKPIAIVLALATLLVASVASGELPPDLAAWPSAHSLGRPARDRYGSKEFEEIDFVPRPLYPPGFARRDSLDPNFKPDVLFDGLLSRLNASSFDRIVKVNWNSSHDAYPSPDATRSSEIAVIEAQSSSFETADNMTRVGYLTAAEVQGNPNEIVVNGNLRMPIPRVAVAVTVYDKEGQPTPVDVMAISSRDIVMAVQFIVNKHWKKIFVTSITPKESVVFRSNFKCDADKSFEFCKQVQEIVNREVLGRLDSGIRDALKFKLEEMEIDL